MLNQLQHEWKHTTVGVGLGENMKEMWNSEVSLIDVRLVHRVTVTSSLKYVTESGPGV